MTFAAFNMPLEAAYTFRDGKIVDAKLIATMSLEEHYNIGVEAMNEHNWHVAARQFAIAAANFPLSPYGQLASFYQGVANYNLGEYDLADQAFSEYLEGKSNPELFDVAMEFKYSIAERFRLGARRRLLGTKQLPKWASAESYAVRIYEEIIAAIPSSELAVQSLFSKGLLQWSERQYSDAVDCFQMIIRRFPRHELAPECYIMINCVYLDQAKWEVQNSDLLAFAEINARRFAQAFPREDRIIEVEAGVLAIKEVYAKGLYDTGIFYEKVGYPRAAILYYRTAIIQFPDTEIAGCCYERLNALGYEMEQVQDCPIEECMYSPDQFSPVSSSVDEEEMQKATLDWLQ